MMIYFNKNKEAHAYKIDDYIASITMDVWSKYSEGKVGVDWDIIDGKFTPLVSLQTLEERAMLPIRSSERGIYYSEADDQISKCNDYIGLDIDSEKYSGYKTELIRYKMSVRNTVNQKGYPLIVEYPEFPRLEQ